MIVGVIVVAVLNDCGFNYDYFSYIYPHFTHNDKQMNAYMNICWLYIFKLIKSIKNAIVHVLRKNCQIRSPTVRHLQNQRSTTQCQTTRGTSRMIYTKYQIHNIITIIIVSWKIYHLLPYLTLDISYVLSLNLIWLTLQT